MIISGLEANKMHLKLTALFINKAKWAFLVTLCYIVFFYDVNLTISPLDRPITALAGSLGLSCIRPQLTAPFYSWD